MTRTCAVVLLTVAAFGVFTGCESTRPAVEYTTEGLPNLLTAQPGVWVPLFDGSSLKGWERVGEKEGDTYGQVSVEDGAIVLHEGMPMTGIRWAGTFPRDNYEVSLEANRLAGFDFFCGMTFPVGTSYCTLICGGWGGSIVGLSNVDEFAADNNETTTSIDFDNKRWYKIRLRVSQEAIKAWIDEKEVINLPRPGHRFSIWPEQEPVRPFGVATWNTTGALRNFSFRNL